MNTAPSWVAMESAYNVCKATLKKYRDAGANIYDPIALRKWCKATNKRVVTQFWKDPITGEPLPDEVPDHPGTEPETLDDVIELQSDAPPELKNMRSVIRDMLESIRRESDPAIQNRWRQEYVKALGTYHSTVLKYQQAKGNTGATLELSDVEATWQKFLITVRASLENMGTNVSMAMDGYETDQRADVERLVKAEVDNLLRILQKPLKL
jgi:hypothetical protein